MKQKIYNLIVLDASGSMYTIRQEAIAGVVETVQTIRSAQEKNASQEQLLSLVVFNGSSIATVYDRMPIANVPDFNERDYQPTDNTPLYDAMGSSITHLRHHINEDDNVLVTIITDGYENSSIEWNRQQILQLVEELKKTNWLFTYIGANQDALAVAQDMGIDHSLNFRSDSKGTKGMFLKEKLARSAFYDKLAEGMHFSKAKSEKFFMDEEDTER